MIWSRERLVDDCYVFISSSRRFFSASGSGRPGLVCVRVFFFLVFLYQPSHYLIIQCSTYVCKILWHLSWVDHRNYSEDNSDNETTSKITLTMTMPTPPYSNSMMTTHNWWWWWWWQKPKFRDRLNSSPGLVPCTHHPIFSQADQRWTGTRALSLSLLQNMLVFCLRTRHGPVTHRVLSYDHTLEMIAVEFWQWSGDMVRQ